MSVTNKKQSFAYFFFSSLKPHYNTLKQGIVVWKGLTLWAWCWLFAQCWWRT